MSEKAPVLDREALSDLVRAAQDRGERVVLTNGAFDLLHVGHVRCLQGARAEGDVLVVAVNGDASVARAKGADRPVHPAAERVEVLQALGCVDAVHVFEEDTVDALLEAVRPDVHAKGRDYEVATLPERATNERLGIRMAFVGDEKAHSTSALVARRAGRFQPATLLAAPDAMQRLDVSRGEGFVARRARGWVQTHLGTAEQDGVAVARIPDMQLPGVRVQRLSTGRGGEGANQRLHAHLALRAAGLPASAPLLAYEGTLLDPSVLVLVDAPGPTLGAWCDERLAGASPRERLARARQVGGLLRALHTARFLLDEIPAHSLGVTPDGVSLREPARLRRAGRRLKHGAAIKGLASLRASLPVDMPPRLLLAALRAYLGGSLRMARPWLKDLRAQEAVR